MGSGTRIIASDRSVVTTLEDIRRAHQVLGLKPYADDGDLQASYRRLARRTHPDAGGSPEDFRQVQEAYELLKDPCIRIVYQRRLDEAAERREKGAQESKQGRARASSPPPPSGSAKGTDRPNGGAGSTGETHADRLRTIKERRVAEEARALSARHNRRFLWAALAVFLLGNTVLSPLESSFGILGPTLTPFVVLGVAVALGVTWFRRR